MEHRGVQADTSGALASQGYAGHAIVAFALAITNVLVAMSLRELSVLVAVLVIAITLVGRKEFQGEREPKGAGLAGVAFVASCVTLLVVGIPALMPFVTAIAAALSV